MQQHHNPGQKTQFGLVRGETFKSERKSGLGLLGRKRSNTDDKQNYYYHQYVKKFVPHRRRGGKIIKIEIYDDTDNLSKPEPLMCNCKANVCAQHVVKFSKFDDDIYTGATALIAKIRDAIEPRSP